MCNLGKAWQLNREGMQACNKGDFEKAENNLKTAIQMSQCKSKKSIAQPCTTILRLSYKCPVK